MKKSVESPAITQLRNQGVGEKLIDKFAEGELTANEVKVLNWLIKEGWDPYEYGFSDVEVSDIGFAVEIGTKSAKGVVGSLVKKGYVYTADIDGVDIVYANDIAYQLDDDEKWG